MSRDLKIDGLKFIMIFCVVLGHMKFNDYGLFLRRIIYSFHMPVFVFLSGYLTSESINIQKRFKWIRQTLSIYAIAQALHIVLRLFLKEPITFRCLIYPEHTLWYLISLIYWRLSIWTVFKNTSLRFLAILSVFLSITSGFIPIEHDFSFQRTFAFAPFFIMGYIFKKNNSLPQINRIPYFAALLLLIAGTTVARKLPIYSPWEHYTNWDDVEIRVCQTLIGGILCLSIIRLSRIRLIERFADFGKYSLWIYIGHSFLTRIDPIERFLHHYFGIERTLWSACLICSFYCFLFISIARLFYYIKGRQEHSEFVELDNNTQIDNPRI